MEEEECGAWKDTGVIGSGMEEILVTDGGTGAPNR